MAFYRLKEIVVKAPMIQPSTMGEEYTVMIGGEEMVFSREEFETLFEEIK